MKWFYIISSVTVLLLGLAPFALLKPEKPSRFDGKVVGYNIYMEKVKSLDPATCGDVTSADIQGNFYESLFCYAYLKRPLEVIPQLAEAMPEVSPDGLTYTIPLKKGVKYSRNACFGYEADGKTPKTRTVTAEDFVLSFKRIGDFHINSELSLAFVEDKVVGLKEYRDATRAYDKGDFSRYQKETLAGVTAQDEHTLQITLTQPFPQLLYVLALDVYAPIPHEVVDYYLVSRDNGQGGRESMPMRDRSPEILDRQAVVGTGPYLLTEFDRGGTIVLERNPEFREEYYPSEGSPGDREAGLLADAGKRVPFVDVRYLTFVQESNPAWMLFVTKQRDTSGVPRDVYDAVISPARELDDTWKSKGIRLLKYTDPSVYWLAFNVDDRVVGKSKSLRQALNLCFNVESYIDVLLNGRGTRSLNTIPSTFDGYEQAGPSPYARFDLALARQKVADARQELVAAGVIQPGQNIPTLTLDVGGVDEQQRRDAEFIQGQFRQIGIDLKIEMNDWPTLQEKVHNKQCQIYSMGWHADYPDAENFLQLYYSKNIDRGTNNTNYSNPEFDKLYEQASVMMPSPQRTELYVKMIRMLGEDCPVLLLFEPVNFTLSYDWVYNVKPHPIGYGFGRYTRIDPAQRAREGGR